MNGSSDISWEGIAVERDGVPYKNIMLAFPGVRFYDYTKNASRLYRDLPDNYNLTLSYTGENFDACLKALSSGHNVAVCFDALPQQWMGFDVTDGDLHDLRFLDDKGVIVGLLPKGRKAKNDKSGFVVRNVANILTMAA